MNGHRAFFLPFYFKLSPDKKGVQEMQAQLILELADQFLRLGYQEIGFMYFSNQKNRGLFQRGANLTGAHSNLKMSCKMDSQVLSELDKKLESDFFHLRSKFKILPKCTEVFNDKTDINPIQFEKEFDFIKPFIENGRGRVLLGWLTQDFLQPTHTVSNKKMGSSDLFSSILHRLIWEALSDLQTMSPVPPEYQVLIKEPMYLSDLSQHEFGMLPSSKSHPQENIRHLVNHPHLTDTNYSSMHVDCDGMLNQNHVSLNLSAKSDAAADLRKSAFLARLKNEKGNALFWNDVSSFDLTGKPDFIANVPRSTLQKKSHEFQLAMDMIRTIKTVTLALSGLGLTK